MPKKKTASLSRIKPASTPVVTAPTSGSPLTVALIDEFIRAEKAERFVSDFDDEIEGFASEIFGYFIGRGVDAKFLTPRILRLLEDHANPEDYARAKRIVEGTDLKKLKIGDVVKAAHDFERSGLSISEDDPGVVIGVPNRNGAFEVCWFMSNSAEDFGKCEATVSDIQEFDTKD